MNIGNFIDVITPIHVKDNCDDNNLVNGFYFSNGNLFDGVCDRCKHIQIINNNLSKEQLEMVKRKNQWI